MNHATVPAQMGCPVGAPHWVPSSSLGPSLLRKHSSLGYHPPRHVSLHLAGPSSLSGTLLIIPTGQPAWSRPVLLVLPAILSPKILNVLT